MSIELSRRHGLELDEVLSDASVSLAATVAGLPWRTAATVGVHAVALVEAALSNPATSAEALELVFGLSPREKHPLNADWLFERLAGLSLAARDALLLPWFHARRGEGGAVDMLISWARRSSMAGVRPETARLWATALLFCTAAADRRVRDGASRGLARLFTVHADASVAMLKRFLAFDDDWVVERALLSSYGARLCAPDDVAWSAVAQAVWDGVFAGGVPRVNALIRDTARCVLEEAVGRGRAPSGVDIARTRPPHASPWPTQWPDAESVQQYSERNGYPQILASCSTDEPPAPPFTGDFGRYVIESAMGRFEVDDDAAKFWVVHEVASLYDPARHAAFDTWLIDTFGRERGRPRAIERIGKKYQWIALARLIAMMDDHAKPRRESWDPPSMAERTLQGVDLRDFDPTLVVRAPPEEGRRVHAIWVPRYNWTAAAALSDEDWIPVDDIPPPPLAIAAEDAGGRARTSLFGSYEWRGAPPEEQDYPYRVVWQHVHGILVANKDRKKLVDGYSARELGNDQPFRGLDAKVFAGEFPFGLPMQAVFHQVDHDGRAIGDATVDAWPAVYSVDGTYEYDGTGWTRVGLLLPNDRFFGAALRGLRWNGRGGWCDGDILVAANTPPLDGDELTMDAAWLETWLASNDMALVWMEVAEKNITEGHARASTPSQLSKSRMWWTDKRGLHCTQPVVSVR